MRPKLQNSQKKTNGQPYYTGLGSDISDMTPKAQATKSKIVGPHQTKNLCTTKERIDHFSPMYLLEKYETKQKLPPSLP